LNKPEESTDEPDVSALELLAEGVLKDESDPSSKAALAGILLSERYSGNFAHPDVLRRLDGVIKDGAERGFMLTEREQEHRHKLDEKLVDSQVDSNKREAQDRRLVIVLSFVFVFLALAGAFVAILTGHPVGAGLAGGAAVIIGGLSALVWRRLGNQRSDGPGDSTTG
jgi:uncharacterized membrane protein